jgi:hypothetical protein
MDIAYEAVTILVATVVLWSAIGKVRRDPYQVRVIHEIVGVALKYFPVLAACEGAGAGGVVLVPVRFCVTNKFMRKRAYSCSFA